VIRNRALRSVSGALSGPVAVLALAACGGSSHGSPGAPAPQRTTSTSAASVSVSTRTLAGLGRVLVDGRGRTLSMFEPDKRRRVTEVIRRKPGRG